jgi:hypothetical protein
MSRFFCGDAHGDENDGKGFFCTQYFRLPRNLQRQVVMGETRSRENGQFLPSNEGIHSVYRGNAGLDEFRWVISCIGVNRRARYVESLLRHDLWTAINRFT